MPQIVPSQAVKIIGELIPAAKNVADNFTLDRSQRNNCVTILAIVDQIPGELLVPPKIEDYIELISNISILRFTLESWKTRQPNSGDGLAGKDGKGNPVAVIYSHLSKCPDEVITSSITGLEFIDDTVLRTSLRQDLSTVESTLLNGEFKAATLLAGSVTEALLLWAIRQVEPMKGPDIITARKKHGITKTDLNQWALDDYNKVARELGVIEQKTFDQVDLARGFRNLIHPGLEIRTKEKCTLGTAYAGKAAVEFVIEDLAKNFPVASVP